MKTIFLGMGLFSHYSDILRSPLATSLAERYRVVVLTQHLDEKTAKKNGLPVHPNLHYRKLTLSNPRLWGISNKYLRHAFVREYDHWTVTRHWYYRKTHPFAIRFLTFLGSLLPSKLLGSEFFTKLEGLLAQPSPQLTSIFDGEQPELLITATPGYTPFEAELIVFGKKRNVKSVAININYDNAYSQAKFFRKTDWIFVWSERMREEIEKTHHYVPDMVRVTGCLRFDHYFNDPKEKTVRNRDAFLRAKGLDPSKKTIVFTGPSPIMYPPRAAFMDALVNLKKNGFSGDPNLFIRLHPHDVWAPYEPYVGKPGIHIELAGSERITDLKIKGQRVEMEKNDLVNLTETLLHADVVINFVSTMIIEASIFDKPIVSIGFPETQGFINRYEFNRSLIETGCLRLANTPNELQSCINRYLASPSLDHEARTRVVKDYITFTDGLSWQRTLESINTLLKHP